MPNRDQRKSDHGTLAARPAVRKLLASADDAVHSVLATDFVTDRLFGPELSAVISRGGSLQKRHGNLLQQAIVAALRASERYTVLTNQDVLITSAADSVVASTPPESLGRLHLRYDAPAVRTVNVDIIAIDEEAAWAGAYDCKRGGGALTQRLLRPLVRDLEAIQLLLRSHLRDRGYGAVDRVSVGIVDVYGGSGAPDYLTITGDDLDALFGVPVRPVLDLLTDRMGDRFQRGIADSIGPLFDALQARAPAGDLPPGDPEEPANDPAPRLPAKLSGPRRGVR